MKSINIGIFHDNEIGKELGKAGTGSDILFFNKKTDDCIFTFMSPVDDKLVAKAEIMQAIDAAIVSFSDITPELGETILMLNSIGLSNGVVLIPPYSDLKPITELTKGTSLENFYVKEKDSKEIFEKLSEMVIPRDNDSPGAVVIDHSFNVKGVGQIILGFVKSGEINRHDKMRLLPADKEVIIRSIQMHDKDFDKAPAGSRVGLAIKGAEVEEMKRGSILCAGESYLSSKKIELIFEPNEFYTKGGNDLRKGSFHVSIGMQTVLVNITEITDEDITIESEKPIIYEKDDVFLLLDLNAEKIHLMGKGKPVK